MDLQCGRPGSDPWVGKIPWRRDRLPTPVFLGFPYGSAGKESTCNAGDLGSIPGLGRSPEEGKGYPLQYSGLENPHGQRSREGTVHGVAKSQTWLSDWSDLIWSDKKKLVKVKVQIVQSDLTLCWPCELYSPWNSPGQNIRVGSLSLLQGVFSTQGSDPGLPHCRWILYQLRHREAQEYWSGSLSLLQEIFMTQELNWGLLHCRQIFYQLNYIREAQRKS